MRELKFRVWSEKQKTYDYKHPYNTLGNFYINQNGCLFSDYGNAVTPEIRQSDFVVEQYTGLKDKNGKEMFEGDIVRRCEEGGFNDIVGVIEWSEKSARFWVNHYYYPNGKNWVVIGNIHENPELLGGKE